MSPFGFLICCVSQIVFFGGAAVMNLDFTQPWPTPPGFPVALMYTLVPEAIIIGGGVAKAGDLLFEPLMARLKEQLFPVHYAALRVLPAHFGADSGLIGAGLMAADYAAGKLS